MSLYLEDRLNPSWESPEAEEEEDVEDVVSFFGPAWGLLWEIPPWLFLLWKSEFPFLRWLGSNIFGSKDHEFKKASNIERGYSFINGSVKLERQRRGRREEGGGRPEKEGRREEGGGQ
jgi:hypothetical protein